MTNTEYDNQYICPKCGGQNDYKVVESINLHPCEIETKCTECGWEDYWAYGGYDSNMWAKAEEAFGQYAGEDEDYDDITIEENK